MTELKKTGVKIHIGVDILGNPYAAEVTTANVSDRDGAVLMFSNLMYSNMEFTLPRLEKVMCDGGYTGDEFAMKIYNITGAQVEIAKRSELHKFVVMPKRWIVERSFAWLDKCRRLWKNCERFISTTLSMVKLAFISILIRRL